MNNKKLGQVEGARRVPTRQEVEQVAASRGVPQADLLRAWDRAFDANLTSLGISPLMDRLGVVSTEVAGQVEQRTTALLLRVLDRSGPDIFVATKRELSVLGNPANYGPNGLRDYVDSLLR